MLILNASKFTKSIMTDRGDLIQIKPGEMSNLMVASRNLICAAMSAGDPDEVGIILDGSYELEIARKISGAAPYIYTDIDEAKSKLIDPSIDYKANINAKKVDIELQSKVDELTKKLELAIKESEQKDAVIKRLSAEDLKIELQDKVSVLESELRKTNSNKVIVDGQLKEAQDQISNLTKSLNEVRSELGAKSQELTAALSLNDKLSIDLKEAQSKSKEMEKVDMSKYLLKEDVDAQISEYEDSISTYNKKLETYKQNLEEAANTIESMKTSFNNACEKFGLYLDDKGNWESTLLKNE